MEDYLITHKSIKISDEELKQELNLNKRWYDEYEKNIRNEFSIFLDSIKASAKIIDLSKKINWQNILVIVNQGISELWNKFKVAVNLEEANQQGGNFRSEMINHIKINVFYYVYLILNNQIDNSVNKKSLNKELFDTMKFKVYSILKIFDFQYNLTSLSYNDDSKIIAPKIQELYKSKEEIKEFRKGKRFKKEEIPTYEIILMDYKKLNGKGNKVSYKELCYKWANENHNLSSYYDLENFSTRFKRYKKKKDENKKN